MFFENKDRFYYPDFEKVNDLIVNNDYTNDIVRLLAGRTVDVFFFGIGLPTSKHSKGSKDAAHLVDFIVGVEESNAVSILYNPKMISFA